GREVLDQFDLLVREWPYLLAVDDDRADKVVLLQHRCNEQRASAPQVDNGNRHWGALEVRRQRPSVADVDDLLRPDDLGMTGPRRAGERLRTSAYAGGTLWTATLRNPSPSKRFSTPNLASQMRVAFSSIDWNTGSKSPGKLLMTCSTSEVAVCCSSASARCSRASASSRLDALSCSSRSVLDARRRST